MSRKKCKTSTVPNEYHSASSVHNFMMNDTLSDFLNYLHPEDVDDPETFLTFIKNKGTQFEKTVVEKIKDVIEDSNEKFVQVSHCQEHIRDVSFYEETIRLIKDKTAVIYQGVLHGNKHLKAYGSPDLIVRSDIVKLFIEDFQSVEEDPYVIIDIKSCTLKFAADKKTLLNEGRMPANKGQIAIYNELLGLVTGHTPDYCYILGKGWVYPKDNSSNKNWNNKLGLIDFYGKDAKYVKQSKEAHKWLDKLKANWESWTLYPPSVPELYPNMCAVTDNPYKAEIAKNLEEITQLWNIGTVHRQRAHDIGIYKLSDPKLSADILGVKVNSAYYPMIDCMIRFNQEKIFPGSIMHPPILITLEEWQQADVLEFFLDFETMPGIISDQETSSISMVGLGVTTRIDGKNTWSYYNFRVPDFNENYDKFILFQMFKKMEELLSDVNNKIGSNMDLGDVNVFHWGSIENTILENASKKYPANEWPVLNLIDFNRVFVNNRILVKGVYNFGLKSIGKGMIEHGLIDSTGWDPEVSNGLDAMLKMYNIYKNSPDGISDEILPIIKYNEVDVRIMEKIINYIREKMTIRLL